MDRQTDLQSWRKQSRSWSTRPLLLAMGAVGIATLVSCLAFQLIAPYHIPKVYVLALAPVHESADHEAHQIPALINSRVQTLQQALLQSGDRGSFWDIPTGLNINALRRLKMFSFERENDTSLGILYISGLMDFHEHELYIYGSHSAKARGEGISVEQIFGFAEQSCYASCMILVDIIPEVEKPLDSSLHLIKMSELRSAVAALLPTATTEIAFLIQTASASRDPASCFSGALAKTIDAAPKDQEIRLGDWIEALRQQVDDPIEIYTNRFDSDLKFAMYRDATEDSSSVSATDGDSVTSEVAPTLVSSIKIPDEVDPFQQDIEDLESSFTSATPEEYLQLTWARLNGLNMAQAYSRFPCRLTELENRLVAYEKCLHASAYGDQLSASGPDKELVDLTNELNGVVQSLFPTNAALPTANGSSIYCALKLERDFSIPANWSLATDRLAVRELEVALEKLIQTSRVTEQTDDLSKQLDALASSWRECFEIKLAHEVLGNKHVPDNIKGKLIACKLMGVQLFFARDKVSELAIPSAPTLTVQLSKIEEQLRLHVYSQAEALAQIAEIENYLVEQLEVVKLHDFASRLLFLMATELSEWQTIVPPVSEENADRDSFVFATRLVAQLRQLLAVPVDELDKPLLTDCVTRLWTLREYWLGRNSTTIPSEAELQVLPAVSAGDWLSPRWDKLQVSSSRRLDTFRSKQGSQEHIKSTELRRLGCLIELASLAELHTSPFGEKLEQCRVAANSDGSETQFDLMQEIRNCTKSLLRSSLQSDKHDSFDRVLIGRLAGQLMDYQQEYDSIIVDLARRELRTYFQEKFDGLRISARTTNGSLETQLASASKGLRNLESRLALPPADFQVQEFSLELPESISLTTRLQRQTSIKVANRSENARPFQVELSFDRKVLDCKINGSSKFSASAEPGKTAELSLEIARLVPWADATSLQIRLTSEGFSCGRSISLDLPGPPSIRAEWIETSSGKRDADRHLVANASNIVHLNVQNLRSPESYQFRLWTTPKSPQDLLLGGLTSAKDSGQVLRELHCTCITDWTLAQTLLEKEITTPIFAKAPNLKVPLDTVSFQSLILECKTNTGGTQLVSWQPRVLRPDSYVDCKTSYDSERRLVDFRIRRLAKSRGRNIPICLTVYEADTLKIIDQQNSNLRIGNSATRLQWANFPQNVDKLLFRLDVDGWPSAFLYSVAAEASSGASSRVLAQDDSQAYVLLEELADNQRVVQGNKLLNTKVICMGKNGLLDETDLDLRVGIDLNQNRVLDDGNSVALTAPISVQSRLEALSEDGSLQLFVEVGGPRANLPAKKEWNTRSAILAELSRQGQKSWSPIERLVFDNTPPRILHARPTVPIAEAGLPLTIQIATDDDGLSGTAAVQTGWSLGGSLDFSAITPVPAIRKQAGQWLVVLPTKTLPPGKHLFLALAKDAAGNTSKLFFEWIEIVSPEAAKSSSQKSSAMVQGSVKYGKAPQPGINLKLSAVSTNEKDEPTIAATCVSDAEGKFQFLNVPQGDYVLELSGIARGMKENRVVEVSVKDDVKPVEVNFRLDLPAVSSK